MWFLTPFPCHSLVTTLGQSYLSHYQCSSKRYIYLRLMQRRWTNQACPPVPASLAQEAEDYERQPRLSHPYNINQPYRSTLMLWVCRQIFPRMSIIIIIIIPPACMDSHVSCSSLSIYGPFWSIVLIWILMLKLSKVAFFCPVEILHQYSYESISYERRWQIQYCTIILRTRALSIYLIKWIWEGVSND